ncbi:hypothetical protein GALL_297710 [mine drainage metagenome]|uniref:Uncharacterized protein n=1 Tax=mine drainage metagenome TaxID=410659 RepID=A0A1J5QXB0_9ZZZZ
MVALPVLTLMVWLALAPTWNCELLNEPSSRLMPLNWVVPATRWISVIKDCASALSAARSEDELVELADCSASWRMRCRLLSTVLSAPSAVCDSEIASLALRTAWSRPLIWAVIRSEIAMPAASSAALLMRRPEERRCSEVCRVLCDFDRLSCALSEAMFVLMMLGILLLLDKRGNF